MSRTPRPQRTLQAYHIPSPDAVLPDGMTRRQAVCVYLYYREGWSYRSIGDALSINQATALRDVRTGLDCLATSAECNGYPIVEEFCSAWCDREQPERSRRIALLRSDRLVQELECALDKRAAELRDVCEVIGTNCYYGALPVGGIHPEDSHVSHKRSKGVELTQSELRYASVSGRGSIPGSAYRAASHARYCASNPRTCGLSCVGCDRRR